MPLRLNPWSSRDISDIIPRHPYFAKMTKLREYCVTGGKAIAAITIIAINNND
jgi:hypothetical protein